MAALLSTLRDSQDIVKDLEDPGVDPSLIKQQIEAAEVSPKIESLSRYDLFFDLFKYSVEMYKNLQWVTMLKVSHKRIYYI